MVFPFASNNPVHLSTLFFSSGYNHARGAGAGLEGDGSHGTHCAGTISADSDNGVGVSGVAGGKEGVAGVSLMTSTCFGQGATGGFAEALVYGADEVLTGDSWRIETCSFDVSFQHHHHLLPPPPSPPPVTTRHHPSPTRHHYFH
jgi:subtilisin family serine protease